MALSLSEIQATTQDWWDKGGAYDNFFTGNVLMYRLLKKGSTVDGGEKIRVNLWYGDPKGGAIGYNSKFDTTRYDAIQAARFDWSIYYEPITYGLKDKVQNAGTAQEVDIVLTKLKMSQKAIKDNMANDLYKDGTAIGDTLPLTGLLAMINSTTSTAYGSIAQDDLSVWAPGTVTTTTEALTLPVMRTLRRNCKVGDDASDVPSIYVTTDALRDTYESLLQPQQRFQDDKLASAGFENLLFGQKPIVSDMKCPSGDMFALNETYMDFKTHKDFNFQRPEWMRPTNEYIFTTQILWVGNMVCMRRAAHGYHSNLS
jgi:hypothetical protein